MNVAPVASKKWEFFSVLSKNRPTFPCFYILSGIDTYRIRECGPKLAFFYFGPDFELVLWADCRRQPTLVQSWTDPWRAAHGATPVPAASCRREWDAVPPGSQPTGGQAAAERVEHDNAGWRDPTQFTQNHRSNCNLKNPSCGGLNYILHERCPQVLTPPPSPAPVNEI